MSESKNVNRLFLAVVVIYIGVSLGVGALTSVMPALSSLPVYVSLLLSQSLIFVPCFGDNLHIFDVPSDCCAECYFHVVFYFGDCKCDGVDAGAECYFEHIVYGSNAGVRRRIYVPRRAVPYLSQK